MPQVLKDDIRDKILEKALRNFTDKGYQGTSMKDIANETGIAVGNIYRYFKNKEVLFNVIAAPVYDSINDLFMKPHKDHSIRGIEQRIMTFIEIYKRNQKIIMMLLNNSNNTRFEDMNNSIIMNFSRAIGNWKEKATGIENTDDDRTFFKAFSTAYLNGVVSILVEPAEKQIISKRLFDFLFFMKDGLFAKYRTQRPADVTSVPGMFGSKGEE